MIVSRAVLTGCRDIWSLTGSMVCSVVVLEGLRQQEEVRHQTRRRAGDNKGRKWIRDIIIIIE